ncbi:hypothetical protein [Paenibacillus xylaniclasticus]|uniref:hypothetical protein n=1 Tax=Paenibacillus xylaniclasticus TaxID=588083 RepID=UPI0013DFBC8E|nr:MULTISPECIES: hypothetical protein [Paenibacillus]GFN32584.1 hypothetical protein PCURB6_28440 [Paenibacillus curdlanolyticus]
MADNKKKELNKIKDDLYDLYPNAISISLTIEGDKILVSPKEKYVGAPSNGE